MAIQIGFISKNRSEKVKVQVVEYKGWVCIDFRVWLQGSHEDAGATIATKKGLCLRPEVVRELLPLLSEALAKAEALDPLEHANGVF
jgi:hypothetical protein